MKIIRIYLTISVLLCCAQSGKAGWTRQDSGTLAWLNSVFFVDESKGWIAGSNGTLLTTDDGGKTWARTRRFTQDAIRDVYFSDHENGWLLCESSPYQNVGKSSPAYILETSDGGKTWQKNRFADGPERITRIFFSKSGIGFAVGEAGTLWRMLDDKKTWKRIPLPVRYLMLDGTFVSGEQAVIVGGGSTVLHTENAGLEWNSAVLPSGSSTRINAVFFIDRNTGWSAGTGGKMFFTSNGGKRWAEQSTPAKDDLTDVAFLDPNSGFVVGDNGIILRTQDGGTNWQAEQTGTKHRLERISIAGTRVFTVGFGGTVLMNDLRGELEVRK